MAFFRNSYKLRQIKERFEFVVLTLINNSQSELSLSMGVEGDYFIFFPKYFVKSYQLRTFA